MSESKEKIKLENEVKEITQKGEYYKLDGK